MRIFNLLTLVAVVTTQVLAQTNLTRLLSEIPQCTLECAEKIVLSTGCQLTNLTSCLCPNVDLQRKFSICVVGACNITEQAESLNALQTEVCEGLPVPSRSKEIIQDMIIMAAVTFPVVILRFWSRSLVASKMGWDDWAVAVGALIMIPMTVIPILNSTRGFGKHFWNVPVDNITDLRKLYYVSQLLYAQLQGLAKVSILFLYLRIFLDKSFRLATWITMAFVVGQTVAFTFVIAFQCWPVVSYWDTTKTGTCINSQAFVYSAAGISIFEDIVIMFLPVMELKALKLDLRKKFALGFMFALGSFASITSMIRLKYIIAYGTSLDLTYDNVDVIIWSVLETFTAIICASLMCFRPLLIRIMPYVFQSSRSGGSKNTPNPSFGQMVSSRLGSRMRSGKNGIELSSVDIDEESQKGLKGKKEIHVQTTWSTRSVSRHSPEGSPSPELGGRVEKGVHHEMIGGAF